MLSLWMTAPVFVGFALALEFVPALDTREDLSFCYGSNAICSISLDFDFSTCNRTVLSAESLRQCQCETGVAAVNDAYVNCSRCAQLSC